MFEAVVKVGGSLARTPKRLRRLGVELSGLGSTHRLLVVPGGGGFADAVRASYRLFKLSEETAHVMALLGMDQYGFLLAEVVAGAGAVYSLGESEGLASQGRIPILLPSRMMAKNQPLPSSWEVTSDSIAGHIATSIGAEKLILVKDVDGLFDSDPRENPEARLVPAINLRNLSALEGGSCLDGYFPRLPLRVGVECYVVNGAHPRRLRGLLEGRPVRCTRITP